MSLLSLMRLMIGPVIWTALLGALCPAAGADDCAVGIIETIAGDGRCCYSGEGGPGTQAALHSPARIALGADQSLYIVDTKNYRVRRVDPGGTITTVAGTGEIAYSGDGGPATEASLNFPTSLAVGPDGSLYIGDPGGHRIRRVDPEGIITAVVGMGEQEHAGDGGPAVEAGLGISWGLTVGADGTLYIAESEGHRIRKVTPDGVITTIAGSGAVGWGKGAYAGDGAAATEARLSFPQAVAVASDGSVYIADTGNHRIRRIDPAGVITTVAGNGTPGFSGDGAPATEASLKSPWGIALGADGSLYVADTDNHRVRMVSTAGIVSTLAGTGEAGGSGDGGPASAAALNQPTDVAVATDGSIYIADAVDRRVRRVGPERLITTAAGTGQPSFYGDDGPATVAGLYWPSGMAFAADGSLYLADAGNHRIRRIDPAGVITTVAGDGTWAGDPGDGGPATQGHLVHPGGVAVGVDGLTYIADTQNNRIRRIDAAGIISTIAGTGEAGFSGDGGPAAQAKFHDAARIAFGADGTLYILDRLNHRIRKLQAVDGEISPTSVITTIAGNGQPGHSGDGGAATEASLNLPGDIALGADGSIYIADTMNNRLRRVDPAGVIATVAGDGRSVSAGDGGPATKASLPGPCAVAVGRDGSLYVAELADQIRRIDPAGIITTIAGSGFFGCWGDGGPATEASLHRPCALAMGGDGCLYIADSNNHRIRRLRWLPCDPEAAKRSADDLRAKADDSSEVWREVFELYVIAKAYGDALVATEKLRALTPEAERMRVDMLVARVYMAQRDDHEARRRLFAVLTHAEDPMALREAADALVDLYLLRGERDQAIATLDDLRQRTRDADLRKWIDQRLAEIAGGER